MAKFKILVHDDRMKTVNVHEAKTHLSRLLDDVRAGEEIIIAKNGRPYARLLPVAAKAKRQPGLLKGGVIDKAFFDPIPDAELRLWEGAEKPKRK